MQGDAISRSALLKQIDELLDLAYENQVHYSLCTIAQYIKEAPSIDIVPRICTTCAHLFYRTIAEGEGCKTISVFCKEKECHNADKWEEYMHG